MNLLKSKTVWLNLIVLVLAVLSLPEFISVLPEEALKYVTLTGAVGNLVLRVYFPPVK